MIKTVAKDKVFVRTTVKVQGKQKSRTATLTAGIDPATGQPESARALRTRALAWIAEAKAQMMSEMQTEARVGPEAGRISAAIERYYAGRYSQLRSSSKNAIRARLTYFERFCQERSIVYLHQFTSAEAQGFWDWLVGEGVVGNGLHAKFDAAKAVLNFEVQRPDRTIVVNPMLNVIRRNVEVSRDVKPLPEPIFHAFMELTPDDDTYWAFMLLAATGMRTSEARNLPIAHVLPRGFIRVREYRATSGRVWKPKYPKSRRVIPETDMARQAIDYFLEKNAGKEYLLGGDEPLGPNWYIHRFEDLRVQIVKHYPEFASEIMSRRPGEKRFWYSSHSLRKLFAGWGLESGMSIDAMKDLMGHSSAYMTELYGKFSDHAMAESVRSKLDLRIPQKGVTSGETQISKNVESAPISPLAYH